MKKKNKISSVLSITLASILLIIGVSFAAFGLSELSTNQQLIVGDIYMHYNETNELILSDIMPIENPFPNVITLTLNQYEHNANLTDDQVNACVSYLTNNWGEEPIDEPYELFCRGTGTNWGETFQDALDSGWELDTWFLENDIARLIDTKVIRYTDLLVNKNMTNDELNRCITLFRDKWSYSKRDYESWDDFCLGTGTIQNETLQERLDSNDWGFISYQLKQLLKENIVKTELNVRDLPYFEFAITGKNTYQKEDIWYEIVLSHGDSHETRKTRIRDDLLKFRLVEIVDSKEKELFNNRIYKELSNKRIWVDTINKNTLDEINKTYRLYMWVDGNTIIGNVDEDYTIEEWNDIYASIKVNVIGDFNEKEIQSTDASCFITNDIKNYSHNTNMTEEEINTCTTYIQKEMANFDEGSDAESFCRGTGTKWGDTFQQILDYNYWWSASNLEYFEQNNIINSEILGLEIIDYDTSCGGLDVVIPNKINNMDVILIGYDAFREKGLTAVAIPGSVKEIKDTAFADNSLSKISISNGVESIKYGAFRGDNHTITEVTLPDSVTNLSCLAFNYNVVINMNNHLECIDDSPAG